MLAGKLQHACKVGKPGRAFLRRVFEFLAAGPPSYSAECVISVGVWLGGRAAGTVQHFTDASRELGGIIIGIAPCSGQEAGVGGMLR